MAKSSSPRYLLLLLLLNVFYLGINKAEIGKAFSFKNFSKELNFQSAIALYGDAKLVDGSGESLQISGWGSYSAGRVMYKKPIKLVAGNPRKMVAFSMHFVFSLSKDIGDGLAFVMVPVGFNLDKFDGGSFGLLAKREYEFVAIEFDTSKDKKVDDMNDNHVGVDVGSFISVKSRNVSSINLELKSGEKLQSWIDYEASSKRLEVRLETLGKDKPFSPFLSCPIDLSHMWKEEVLVGLSASSGNFINSTQICKLYSWAFELRTPPLWMHFEPLDPKAFNLKSENMILQEKKSDCPLKVLAAFIFGTACGALGAFVVLFIWTILGSKRLPVVPMEYALPAKEVDCEMT